MSQITHQNRLYNNHVSIMTCLEYERLSREDFVHPQDFDYLLVQELACFDIILYRGTPKLVVKHYLAKIALPSGIQLEILPKISDVNTALVRSDFTKKSAYSTQQLQKQIYTARSWVKQMLLDIASQSSQQLLPAIDLSGGNLGSLKDELQRSKIGLEHSSYNDSISQDKPWYDWILQLAQRKIYAAQCVLPSDYQMQTQNNPQANGKLNLKAQLTTNWHRPHYLHTQQAVLQDNDDITQFLATSSKVLRELQGNTQSSRLIRHNRCNNTPLLAPHLWQTVYERIESNIPNWHSQLSSKQKPTLEQGLAWAWWVLKQSSVSNGQSQGNAHSHAASGGLPMPALMINMNHAFEQWVLARLNIWVNQHLPNSQLIVQPSLDWLAIIPTAERSGHSEIIQRLVPDAYIRDANQRISHVIDIKYKKINRLEDVSSSDWQQLYSYRQHLTAQKAWLIYPMTLGFKTSVTVRTATTLNDDRSLEKGEMAAIPFDVQLKQIVI